VKILALETSTNACSAALWIDGVMQEKFALTPKAHTRLILPMVDELMAEAQLRPQQLDAIALSRGPGSFTGVRIAASVVQGIAFGADLPVVPVSTLAAIAQDFFNQHTYAQFAFTAMDARMDEIFWGVYQQSTQGFAVLNGAEVVTPALQIEYPDRAGYGVGSGWAVYATELQNCLGERLLGIEADYLPRAAAVAQLGAQGFTQGLAVDVELAMPVYLRDKVAKTQAERAKEAG
jgi:tRNA threonylcarbamoyladenosine biosynthesis protein TsaB